MLYPTCIYNTFRGVLKHIINSTLFASIMYPNVCNTSSITILAYIMHSKALQHIICVTLLAYIMHTKVSQHIFYSNPTSILLYFHLSSIPKVLQQITYSFPVCIYRCIKESCNTSSIAHLLHISCILQYCNTLSILNIRASILRS